VTAPRDESAEREARRLGQAWEQRAQSPARDFFVASHPGWDDPATWEAQARHDADFLLQQLRIPLPQAHLLEIGCGVGRLAAVLAPRVASYTGFDIAPSMVAEARARHRSGNTRFFEADGLSVPAGARDRNYHLALAHAVFIHCPREVIATLIADAWTLLADGGELRFQLRADPEDEAPLLHLDPEPGAPAASPAAADRAHDDARAAAGQELEGRAAVPTSQVSLVEERDYMGATFRSEAVLPFLQGLPGVAGARISAARVDRLHIYAALRRPVPD